MEIDWTGRPCLIVLGGPSGKLWKQVAAGIATLEDEKPALLACNGSALEDDAADAWLVVEPTAWKKPWFEQMLDYPCPKFIESKCIGQYRNRSGEDLLQADGVYPVERRPLKIRDRDPNWQDWDPFSLDAGLASGDMMRHTEAVCHDHRVGTVALQAINLAMILGCRSIHTIGWDLRVIPGEEHHWYPDTDYKVDNGWWTREMLTKQMGAETFWYWVETAEYMLQFENLILKPNGVRWRDHSDLSPAPEDWGLLRRFGLGRNTTAGA